MKNSCTVAHLASSRSFVLGEIGPNMKKRTMWHDEGRYEEGRYGLNHVGIKMKAWHSL